MLHDYYVMVIWLCSCNQELYETFPFGVLKNAFIAVFSIVQCEVKKYIIIKKDNLLVHWLAER